MFFTLNYFFDSYIIQNINLSYENFGRVKIKKNGCEIIIQFKSKSFLQNQVRSMVGSLSYLARKKWNLKEFKKIFKSRKRGLCAPPAPACGLYLKIVMY